MSTQGGQVLLLWEQAPTMGYLSLVRQARVEYKIPAVSIFVHPTRFGPHENLGTYLRDVSRDLQLLKESDVDVVFTRSDALY